MGNPFAKVVRIHRYEGVIVLLWAATRKLLSPIADLSLDLLFERSTVPEVPTSTASVPISIRPASEDDLIELIPLIAGEPFINPVQRAQWNADLSLDELQQKILENYRTRISNDSCPYVAVVDGQSAHLNWLCLKKADTWPGGSIELNVEEVYTTDAFTVPSRRGLNLHSVVLEYMLHEAHKMGRKRAYTYTNLMRASSYRGLFRLGWSLSGIVLFVRWPWSSAGKPFHIWGNTKPYFASSPT